VWTEEDRASPFHGENRGSNPRGDAILNAVNAHGCRPAASVYRIPQRPRERLPEFSGGLPSFFERLGISTPLADDRDNDEVLCTQRLTGCCIDVVVARSSTSLRRASIN
jgi:hypothetical protein